MKVFFLIRVINEYCRFLCSAGVGRTGTYIAVDVNLEQAKHEGLIDVHNFVQLMRTQRVNMVQTLVSYATVYCSMQNLSRIQPVRETAITVDDMIK